MVVSHAGAGSVMEALGKPSCCVRQTTKDETEERIGIQRWQRTRITMNAHSSCVRPLLEVYSVYNRQIPNPVGAEWQEDMMRNYVRT